VWIADGLKVLLRLLHHRLQQVMLPGLAGLSG
jgi:hypothetical protein